MQWEQLAKRAAGETKGYKRKDMQDVTSYIDKEATTARLTGARSQDSEVLKERMTEEEKVKLETNRQGHIILKLLTLMVT